MHRHRPSLSHVRGLCLPCVSSWCLCGRRHRRGFFTHSPLSVVCLCVRVCPCVVVRSCLVRLLVRRALLGARVCLAFILDTGGRLSSCRRRLPPCLSALAVCVGWLALGSLRVRACVRVLAPRRGVLSASPLVAPAGLP